MGLRAKLAAALFAILCCAILGVSIASLDHTLRVMASDLVNSGDRVAKETFEQMRGALQPGSGDPVAAMRRDRGLRIAIEAGHAFGQYVVYVRIVSSDGTVLMGTQPESEPISEQSPLDIAVVQHLLDSRIPLRLLPELWRDRVYQVSMPVGLGDKPFGAIEVGVSTGLIAHEVHNLVTLVLLIALGAILLSTLVAYALGNQFIRRVRAITSGVEQLTAGRAELVKLDIEPGTELATLADRFNQLSRRIRAEREQWESEGGRLVNVFRSITDAVLLLDADGSLLFANAEARRRLGLKESGGQSEGKPLSVLLGADHPLTRLLGPALQVGSEVHDVALELPDGDHPARFLASIFSLGGGPAPAGLLVMLRDLAQMSELETVVDYSSRLARLGGLLSGVAHQLRSPLNAMSLQLEILRQAGDGAPVAQVVERLRREIKRLDGAVEALMRFMRPQALKTAPVPLNDLLMQIGGRVNDPKVKLEYALDRALPAVTADAELLSEALQNIVQNAVQAMKEGGALTIRSARVDEGSVEVTIADQGTGIKPDDLDHIFDLYFTTKEGGTGLGLPLAMRAIDLHRGSIKVESHLGSGTTFRIRLPIGETVPTGARAS